MCVSVLAHVYDIMCHVYVFSGSLNNNIDLNYWFHSFVLFILHPSHGQLEQHRGQAQQITDPLAPH